MEIPGSQSQGRVWGFAGILFWKAPPDFSSPAGQNDRLVAARIGGVPLLYAIRASETRNQATQIANRGEQRSLKKIASPFDNLNLDKK